jgi:hypothetical protein
VYQNEAVRKPLTETWLKVHLPCSKRLKAILPIWLSGYVQIVDELSPDITNALLKISPPIISFSPFHSLIQVVYYIASLHTHQILMHNIISLRQ